MDGSLVYSQVTEGLGPNFLVFIYSYMFLQCLYTYLYTVKSSMDIKKNDWV